MGSIACGVAEDHSDIDVYGFAIPPRDWFFPHLRGDISGVDAEGLDPDLLELTNQLYKELMDSDLASNKIKAPILPKMLNISGFLSSFYD